MKLALHSVSYSGSWGDQAFLSLEDFIKKAASLGFDAVELMAKKPHIDIAALDDAAAERLSKVLDENGVKCVCLAAYTDFTAEFRSRMVPYVELQIEYIGKLVKLAARIGCPLIRVFTGNEVDGAPFWEQYKACVTAVRACADEAAKYGVTIGVQNHHDIAAEADAMLTFIEDVGRLNVKAMFDGWVPASTGVDLAEVAKKMAPHMVYTTVADYAKYERYFLNHKRGCHEVLPSVKRAVPMGEGYIDYATFLGALRDAGFDGYVCYEMCSELRYGGTVEALDRYARSFKDYMKALE